MFMGTVASQMARCRSLQCEKVRIKRAQPSGSETGHLTRDGFVDQRQRDNYRFIRVPLGHWLQWHKCWQRCCGLIAVNRQPLADQVGVEAMADGDIGHRDTWLQVPLHDLGLEGFWDKSFVGAWKSWR